MEQRWLGGRWLRLWIHITKPQHEHTHTHKTCSQIRPSLIPLRHFAQLPVLGLNKPHQEEESGRESSSCVSRGLSSVKAEGIPVVGENENCVTFYRLAMLVWRVMNQWLFLLRPRLQRSHLQYPAWQGWTFMTFCYFNHEDCFRRRLSESGHLTFRVSEKLQYTCIFQVRNIYFPLHLQIQSGINCPWDISLTLYCFYNMEEILSIFS